MRLSRAFSRVTVLVAVVGFAANPLAAQTMTFDGNTCPRKPAVNIYLEAGFQLSFGAGYGLYYCLGETGYPGSPAMFQAVPDDETTLTKVGGGSFGITSIDLAAINGLGGTATFTGYYSVGGTVTQKFNWTAPGGSNKFLTNTFAFAPEWTSLLSVRFTQPTPYFQFDNIVLKNGPTVAPEPATVALLAVGLASMIGFGSLRNRTRT